MTKLARLRDRRHSAKVPGLFEEEKEAGVSIPEPEDIHPPLKKPVWTQQQIATATKTIFAGTA